MVKYLFLLAYLVLFSGCSKAQDSNYGTEADPIKVGESDIPRSGPSAERMYLDFLRDKDGMPFSYTRLGSVAPSKSEKEAHILDRYELTSSNGAVSYLYIDMYHNENHPCDQKAPQGYIKVECNLLPTDSVNERTKKMALAGSREALANFIIDHKNRENLKKEEKAEFKELLEKIVKVSNDPEMYYHLASLEDDHNLSQKYYKKAADMHFPPAALIVGRVMTIECKYGKDEKVCQQAKKYMDEAVKFGFHR